MPREDGPAPLTGRTFALIGALAAFPRRIAEREVERRGGRLLRSVTRATTDIVIGWGALDRGAAIAARIAAERAAGRRLLSERGFLRLLGLAAPAEPPSVSRQALLDQTGLRAEDLALLELFDAFGSDGEAFSFRDLILARKYAELLADGAGWDAIARSVHRAGSPASLAARDFTVGPSRDLLVRDETGLREVDGQFRLDLDAADNELDDLFARAEAAEAAGAHTQAAVLYRRCVSLDPRDPVAPYNRANCLRAAGRAAEAAHDYIRALKRDPTFVEAWFNLAALMSELGRPAVARRYLGKALDCDPTYADAIYNLAALAYGAGDLPEAGRLWRRYLEFDRGSEWARRAEHGLRFVATETRRGAP